MKHTPGPWIAFPSMGTLGSFEIDTEDRDYCICETVANLADEEANARLIAAAPELLEALKVLETYASSQICTHDDTHRGGTIWEICDQCGAMWADDKGGKPKFKWPKEIESARAAIAKAEGKG